MNSWRDRIVRKLEAAPGRLTLVADPDDLLLEEQMLQRIEELGFDLLTFDEHVAFRFALTTRGMDASTAARYDEVRGEDRRGLRRLVGRALLHALSITHRSHR